MSALKKLANDFDHIAECIARDINKNEVRALNAVNIAMKTRIFGIGKDGIGKSLDGELMHRYSDQYLRLRRRKNKGLNLAVNLTFDGTMKRAVDLGTSEGKNVIGFNDDTVAQIAAYQEDPDGKQVKKKIFGMTEPEQEEGLRVLIEGNNETLKACSKLK